MGHGDALIAASMIDKSSTEIVLICDNTSETIVKYFFPNIHIRSYNLRPIYDLNKSSFFSITCSFFRLYLILKSLNSEDCILFDKHDFRAIFFSYLTKAKYIRNRLKEKNIYLSRLNYITGLNSFNELSPNTYSFPLNAKIAYFPISRVFLKNISFDTYSIISKHLEIHSSSQQIYKHYLDVDETSNFNFNNYSDINELVSIINKSDFLIVCDSLIVHVAYILKKPFWVVFNENINQKWLPPGAEESYILIRNGKISKIGSNVFLNYIQNL